MTKVYKVDFVSQKVAELILPVDTWALISIRCPGDVVKLKEGWKNIHTSEFHDVNFAFDNYTVFSETQADAIIDFLENLPDDTFRVVVHCLAGISRSAAVALFIRDYYIDGSPWLRNSDCHNSHVRGLLETRYHERGFNV